MTTLAERVEDQIQLARKFQYYLQVLDNWRKEQIAGIESEILALAKEVSISYKLPRDDYPKESIVCTLYLNLQSGECRFIRDAFGSVVGDLSTRLILLRSVLFDLGLILQPPNGSLCLVKDEL